jgi:hypothetical protein
MCQTDEKYKTLLYNKTMNQETPKIDENISAAVLEIGHIMDQVSVLGANSSEIPELLKLLDALKTGKILPEKTLEIARNILAQKQDYH